MGDFGETVHIVSFQNNWLQADVPFDCNMAFGKRTYQRLDLVLCAGDSHVRRCRFEGVSTMEVRGQGMKIDYLTDFAKGIICGFVAALVICGCIGLVIHSRNKDKEKIEYAEKQIEIEALREDIVNRDPVEFLEVPDVRRAADGAAAEFDRKRDEILERYRSGLSSSARLAD